uniref:Uncharacterized protein n=1 Tax=Plasmodium yoelii yoelii TaxID=73239 RepID=Q9XYG6_PLAYO|nr:unknown [Plasmodium yoelii yoelii]
MIEEIKNFLGIIILTYVFLKILLYFFVKY